MNQEEKGKLLLEYEKLKKELAEKKQELERVGRTFQELGTMLSREPQRVLFKGQEYHRDLWGNLPLLDPGFEKWFNIETLKKATSEYRSLCERFNTLQDKKREMSLGSNEQ